MSVIRDWIYRIMVLVCTGLFAYSWFSVWWMAHIQALDVDAVKIFPYGGMDINMGNYPQWLAGAENVMPGWFTPLMWVYFGIVIAVLLFCAFSANEKRIHIGKWNVPLLNLLVACVGITFVVVVAAAAAVIAMNASNFYGGVLNGTIYVEMSEHEASYVTMGLQTGFWITCIVGPVLILLGLLRNVITGNR